MGMECIEGMPVTAAPARVTVVTPTDWQKAASLALWETQNMKMTECSIRFSRNSEYLCYLSDNK